MKRILLSLSMICIASVGHAQYRNSRIQDSFNQFRKNLYEEFEEYRSQIYEEYLNFLLDPWKEFEAEEPVPQPKEVPVPPIVIPEEDKEKEQEDSLIVIEELVKPEPILPQPEPIKPFDEVPTIEPKKVDFSFYGTTETVRYDDKYSIKLNELDENDIAEAMKTLMDESYSNMIVDCLQIRKTRQLCDWAYLQMLKSLAEKIYGEKTNEAILLQAYLYLQSGYKMRLAKDTKKLYMLYACDYIIYNIDSYILDDNARYYCMEKLPERLSVCQAKFPNERSLSLAFRQQNKFDYDLSGSKIVSSRNIRGLKMEVRVNLNLMDFYTDYPTSYFGENIMTRWAMYANVPMDSLVTYQIYPVIEEKLKGMSELEKANALLNMIQTGLEYEFDDKVWGHDRAFFSEETLFYPFCDCEDRSILYTHLIRDLMGLDCVLIYYPGHLASAVNFTEDVKGDYIQINGKKFVICDPTYIGAPVGMSMPGMDNKTANIILLE